jgi:hypothetical protein
MQTNTKQMKSVLAFPVGSVLDVRGKVQKVVKRDGQCKLVIEPANALGFIVYADCTSDTETVRNSKIRKGSPVSVRGKFQTYGSMAVCLSDCRLFAEVRAKKKKTENLTKLHNNGKETGNARVPKTGVLKQSDYYRFVP